MIARRLILAAAAIAAAGLASPAHAQEGIAGPLRIDINIPENRLRVFEGDSLLRSYRISVGVPGHDTPEGEFRLDHAEWNPWWRPPAREWARNDVVTPPGPRNPMGRVKLFFAPYYYIHGTPDAENIGQPASHGCVRMLNAEVIELARLVHARHGGSLSAAQITRVLARPSATQGSRLALPVPLTIRYQPVVVDGDELKVFPDVYSYNRVHTEAVIQALIGAGYDPASIDRAQARRVLRDAEAAKGPFAVKLSEAFTGLRPALGG